MSDSKILLTYKDDSGNYQVESVWATKEGDYYRINNIPFFATNIALNDLIKAEEDDGGLYFEDIVETSGYSVVQIIFFNEDDVVEVEKYLEGLGCTWEGSHVKTLISVDIPKDVNYSIVKNYLDKGEIGERWSYKEACLAHQY
jgi:hypothetical protein